MKSREAALPASRIVGTGRSIPPRLLTNHDLEEMVETSDEWITTRTGIKQRHIVEPGTPLSELASDAAEKALQDAGIGADEIDYIIMGTVTGDVKFPATANFVQARIGAVNAATFDLAAACSGFLYGLQVGDSLIRAGTAEKVLVIGGEILTSMVDWNDRGTCVLFGDGAGAAVLTPAVDERGILSTYTGSNGELHNLLYCHGGGSLYPANLEQNRNHDLFILKMSGNEVFKHAVKTMGDAALTAIRRAGLKPEEVDVLIPHQANIRIIDATIKRLKLPHEKAYINIQDYGNTSSASIPTALDEAREKGVVKEGDIVVSVAFGGGFTWASAAIRF